MSRHSMGSTAFSRPYGAAISVATALAPPSPHKLRGLLLATGTAWPRFSVPCATTLFRAAEPPLIASLGTHR